MVASRWGIENRTKFWQGWERMAVCIYPKIVLTTPDVSEVREKLPRQALVVNPILNRLTKGDTADGNPKVNSTARPTNKAGILASSYLKCSTEPWIPYERRCDAELGSPAPAGHSAASGSRLRPYDRCCGTCGYHRGQELRHVSAGCPLRFEMFNGVNTGAMTYHLRRSRCR